MKLQLTKTAKQELKAINIKLDKTEGEYYNKMSKRERLISDAMLYVDDAYVNNKFKNLDSWCLRTGQGEVPNNYRMRVKKNIGKMLIEDIITIVE
jgi:hypothetical protein